MIQRRKTKVIKIRDIKIGGNHPIAIQSMTKKKTSQIKETLRQIRDLEKEGCQVIRIAIRDFEDTKAIKEIKNQIKVPLVGDIHFNFKLAIEAIEQGVDKIRLNPGNIYKKYEIKEIVECAKDYGIPIRVGVNSGSLRETRPIFEGYPKKPKARDISDMMVKSALDYIKILEDLNFFDIVISLKASALLDTISAYRKMAKFTDYPFHLGITATGPYAEGSIKSAIGIGLLLAEGLGDTIRVSLTSDSISEVRLAKQILQFLGIKNFYPEIISCPTCGRCEVDLIKLVKEFEKKISQSTVHSPRSIDKNYRLPLKVALMGCEVNGPGEAKDADIGIAFGRERGIIFKKGKVIKRISAKESVDVLLKEIFKEHPTY